MNFQIENFNEKRLVFGKVYGTTIVNFTNSFICLSLFVHIIVTTFYLFLETLN